MASTPQTADPLPTAAPATSCLRRTIETIVGALAAFLLMMFFYSGPADQPRYLPEHDSWYHVRLAIMLPEHGAIQRLPWLRYGYLDPSDLTGERFVSHHFGFHVFLAPFVYLSKALTGDYLPGARWAIAIAFGAVFALFNLILAHGGVRWRWIWWIAFALLPGDFLARHGYIRCISPSLAGMLLILLMLFREKYVTAAVAIAGYVLLYLGGVTFTPILVGAYIVALAWTSGWRWPWRVMLLAAGGFVAGLLLYPYPKLSILHFLRLQVLGTGLGADIEVGGEWSTYRTTWEFAKVCGPTLALWAATLALRLRFGPPLDARALTLTLLHFALLALTVKSQRFVEYWPLFALLSAAYLSAPLIAKGAEWWDAEVQASTPENRWFRVSSALLALGVYAGAVILCLKVLPTPMRAAYEAGQYRWIQELATNPYLVAAVGLVIVFAFGVSVTPLRPGGGLMKLADRLLPVQLAIVAALGLILNGAGRNLLSVRNNLRTSYDVPAADAALAYIREHSKPGELVFTDDWDDFGLYFYLNPHNHYIVGLDPKFTHDRRPDLWERFVRITRAQTPTDQTVQMPKPGGGREPLKIHIERTDIRDEFQAQWVLADRHHRHTSRSLAALPEVFELVYPCKRLEECVDAPYVVFRVKGTGE
jgi:hypothetical protein